MTRLATWGKQSKKSLTVEELASTQRRADTARQSGRVTMEGRYDTIWVRYAELWLGIRISAGHTCGTVVEERGRRVKENEEEKRRKESKKKREKGEEKEKQWSM
jgi:hypothetical protein